MTSRGDKFNLGYPEFMVSVGHLRRNRQQTRYYGSLKVHEVKLGPKMAMQLSSEYLLQVAGKTKGKFGRGRVTIVDK